MALLTIVAALASLVGVGNPGQELQVGGLSSSSIRIVESSHRIEFPNRIVLNLQAEAPSDVRTVQLFYTVGTLNIQTYAYPTIFTNSSGLDAEFIIRTGNGGFIPQGVDIEYYYLFTDSQGVETRSEVRTFEYLDPRYDWKRLEKDDFTVLYHNRPERVVRSVATDVSIRLARVKQLYGLTGDYNFKAVLVNDRTEANRSFPATSQTAQDTALYGGFAFGDYGALVLSGASGDGLIHELGHLMLAQAVQSPRARVPSWLNEGLAMYFERGGAFRESDAQRVFRSGDLIRLRHMQTVPGLPEDVRLFYSQSASVVRFLIDTFGEERMSTLLSQIDRGEDIDDALIASYGISVDELDAAWRTQLSESVSFTRLVDPGTLGTSVLIGGALLVTATVVTVRWIKRLGQVEPTEE